MKKDGAQTAYNLISLVFHGLCTSTSCGADPGPDLGPLESWDPWTRSSSLSRSCVRLGEHLDHNHYHIKCLLTMYSFTNIHQESRYQAFPPALCYGVDKAGGHFPPCGEKQSTAQDDATQSYQVSISDYVVKGNFSEEVSFKLRPK